jgi:uracil-DNA glycosylase family 4
MRHPESWEELQQAIITCRRCPRLVAWREKVAHERRRAYQDQDYWGKPVTGFGDPQARLLIVGLAPGAHGANRTGRMFTGDGSGDFLFRALHRAGFASRPVARWREDGLVLRDAYISAICRCAPPANRPNREEISTCLPFLNREIDLLSELRGVVVLGHLAFDHTLRLYRERGHTIPGLKFAHGERYLLGDRLPWLLASYHPSRQNTQTGRLSEAMFDRVWKKARELLEAG